MRKAIYHVIFWLVYMIQDTIYAFLADEVLLAKHSVAYQIRIAVEACGALLLLKIAFTYLMLYGIVDRILRQRGKIWLNILYAILATIGALIVYRAMHVYYIFPNLYGDVMKPQEFWRPTSFFFALIDLGFVCGAALVIRQIRLHLEAREIEKLLVKQKMETELKFLKSQTNPHFLFNTLNNIYGLARKRSDQTAEVVLKLSKMLRFMLYESGREFISITEEVKLIDDYIELERLRYSDRLRISFKKEIDLDKQPVSPLLLLPFVENAFKHGASESFFDSYIDIDLRLASGVLRFSVVNSKEEGERVEELKTRIGLENIRRQLLLMYPEHAMDVQDELNKFTVIVSINLNKYGKI